MYLVMPCGETLLLEITGILYEPRFLRLDYDSLQHDISIFRVGVRDSRLL